MHLLRSKKNVGPCESVERVPEERAKLEEPCVRADMEIEQDSAGGHEKGPELRSQVEHEGEPVVTTEVLGLVKKPQGAKKKLTSFSTKVSCRLVACFQEADSSQRFSQKRRKGG